MFFAIIAVAPLLLRLRKVPRWVDPVIALTLLAIAGLISVHIHKVHGFALMATAVLTVSASAFGGLPLPPLAFRIARQQPDAGDPLPLQQEGPLRGGRMIGILERVSITISILAGWPEGIAIVLAIKGLARYPDLRDSKVSEQFIIGTFTSVLWAIAIAALGRHLIDLPPWPREPLPPHLGGEH